MTPYKETREHRTNFTEPPPDLIDRQPEWEVEKVLGSRRRRNQLQYLIRWKGFSEAHDSWEPSTHINADQLIEDFHQENPAAVRTTLIKTPPANSQTISLCRTTMPTNPTPPPPSNWTMEDTPTGPMLCYTPQSLQLRIDDPPPALTLAERLSDPNRSEPGSPQTQESYRSLEERISDPEEGEIQPLIPRLSPPISRSSTPLSEPCTVLVDQALHPGEGIKPPAGFEVYDRTIANHVTYGDQIRIPVRGQVWPHYIHFDHDFVEHKHYVMGWRDETGQHTGMVGWDLEAAPFMGPPPQFPDNHDLFPFSFTHDNVHAIDLSLGELNDPGLLADVDRHCGLIAEEATLCLCKKELANSWHNWQNRMTPVRHRLVAAQARTRLHPYVTNQVPLQPNQHHDEELTVADALLLGNRIC